MLLDVNKFVDPDDVVHVAWARARETFCGLSKIGWPYPHYGMPVDCQHCRNAYVIASLDEANSDMGFVMMDQAS